MNISENGVTIGVNLTYRNSKSLMEKGGAPGGTRTHNILLRRQTLYPVELPGRLWIAAKRRELSFA